MTAGTCGGRPSLLRTAGLAGDARQPTGRRSLDETDAVPAVLTHTARDGRDYRTGRLGTLMVALLKIDKWDLNATDWFGHTALLWATEMGHDAIVKVLLEREGVDPHIVDRWDTTLLVMAARGGHEGIVEMLLERNNVNPNTMDEDGRTPLSLAAQFGHGEIVRMLLKRNEVHPDATDEGGRTPLSWAAGPGRYPSGSDEVNEKAVEILSVFPSVQSVRLFPRTGRTPYSLPLPGTDAGL